MTSREVGVSGKPFPVTRTRVRGGQDETIQGSIRRNRLIQAYVLIETEVGCTQRVAEAMRVLTPDGARITKVDAITGPYDVIVHFEADRNDAVGDVVLDHIRSAHHGIKSTTTCLVLNPVAPATNGRRHAS